MRISEFMKHNIKFSAPPLKKYDVDRFSNLNKTDFFGISITGKKCELHCSHCNSNLLKFMYQAPAPEMLKTTAMQLIDKGARGFLITGGCDKSGRLPLSDFVSVLCEIKARYNIKLSFHTRMVDERLARDFKDIGADLVMLDVCGSDYALKNIYKIADKTVEDEIKTLDYLEAYNIPIAPHIVLGINFGKCGEEENALNNLKGRKIERLVLVVLMPLRGTEMEGIHPPEIAQAVSFFEKARMMFPQTEINLGCARPGGLYQAELERKALELSFSAIAFPSDETIDYCIKNNYDIEYSYLCCAMD